MTDQGEHTHIWVQDGSHGKCYIENGNVMIGKLRRYFYQQQSCP